MERRRLRLRRRRAGDRVRRAPRHPAAGCGTRAQRAFWEGALRRVGETPEWRALLEREVLDLPSAAPDSAALSRWLAVEELRHEAWMYAGGVFAWR